MYIISHSDERKKVGIESLGFNNDNDQVIFFNSKYYDVSKNKVYDPIALIYNFDNIYPFEIFNGNDILRKSKFKGLRKCIKGKGFSLLARALYSLNDSQAFQKYSSDTLLEKTSILNIINTHMFKIYRIPREIQEMINKPGKNFQELKKILILSEGFYCYKMESLLLPVMCRHLFMSYSNISMFDISRECYRDGKCKYCGTEMNAYHERPVEVLNNKVYSIIYKFIASIKLQLDEENLMKEFFILIYDVIQSLRKQDIDLTEVQQISLAGLYLFKLYDLIKSDIKFTKASYNKFLDTAKKYWNEIGWDNKQIANFKLQIDKDQVNELIKESTFTAILPCPEILPISVLFERYIDITQTITPKNDIEKMFLSHMLAKLNEMIHEKFLSLYLYNYNHNVTSEKFKQKIEALSNIEDNRGEKFWELMYLKYCPNSPNSQHNFINDICKHCSLNCSGKNKAEIYKKYSITINAKDTTIEKDVKFDLIKIKMITIEDIRNEQEITLDESMKKLIIEDPQYCLDLIKNTLFITIEAKDIFHALQYIKSKEILNIEYELKYNYLKIRNIMFSIS
jgi:hypothetical protein